jgi:NO-binding membrane sensor protein with MHYT domain
VPCQADSAGQPQWKTFYLGMLAPEGTCYVSAGLQVTTPVSVGVPVAFRRIGLWVDSPMATAEPPVEAAAAGGT